MFAKLNSDYVPPNSTIHRGTHQMMPVPVMIGLGLIGVGFILAIYIVVASINDRRRVKPLTKDDLD
jgi:hypothetical protein